MVDSTAPRLVACWMSCSPAHTESAAAASPRTSNDEDAAANRVNLLRMIALKERLPEMIIVPAHDMRGFAELPKLSQAGSGTPASP